MEQHRNWTRVMAVVAAVALVGPALADPQSADDSNVGGLMVQVYDADGLLGASPEVTLRGEGGATATVEVRDDGGGEDLVAQDRFYTGGFPSFTARKLEVEIRSGETLWTLKTELDPADDKPLLVVATRSDGTLGHHNSVRINLLKHGRKMAPAESGSGMWTLVGAIAALAFGLSLAFVVALWGRRPRRRARLERDQDHPVIEPTRVEARDVIAALDSGPLRCMRVVVVGTKPDARASGIACLDTAPLPVELVAAVERLAAVPGPAVALLVTEVDSVDSHGRIEPVVALGRAVGGRFPLWVVGGPAGWRAWTPGAPDEKTTTVNEAPR